MSDFNDFLLKQANLKEDYDDETDYNGFDDERLEANQTVNLYTIQYEADYGGGLMVVAARNSEDARSMAKERNTSSWSGWNGEIKKIENAVYKGNPQIIEFGSHAE